jgi:choline dehydrogenase-like flavoprotein
LSADVVIVGTGPAGAFFLSRLMSNPSFTGSVLVLERGERISHREQVNGRRKEMWGEAKATFDNHTPEKPWKFITAFGGSSNCWVGNVPRMLPNDFRLRSRYGVGSDWPISYDELEPYYCEAEQILSAAGPSDDSPFRRSRPYPLGPHELSDVDLALKRRHPNQFFAAPAARPTQRTAKRPQCCGNTPCTLCPIDAKFTVLNELSGLFEGPRVTLLSSSRATRLVRSGGVVRGVEFVDARGKTAVAEARVVALCANAIFNPLLLLESGFEHPELGRGLTEQRSLQFELDLDGLDGMNGGTSFTGHGYMLYDGDHRRERAAALIETSNVPNVRLDFGKWQQRTIIKFIFEDLRLATNTVTRGPQPGKPTVTYRGTSDYTARSVAWVRANYRKALEALPLDKGEPIIRETKTEAHVIGTTPMAEDIRSGPVDRWGRLFEAQNVVVLGSSVFPTAAPANPTLTLASHALFAADRVLEDMK